MNDEKFTGDDFRKYVLSLEEYYRGRYADDLRRKMPKAAATEKGKMLLCGHILEHYDGIEK